MNEEDRLRVMATAACDGRSAAHDMSHVERVVSLARTIATAEDARVDVVVPAALLHELVNLPKGHPDSARSGELCAVAAESVLRDAGVEGERRVAIFTCIREHSFSRGLSPSTKEAAVLQDADRLDAIGAVGVARCFATSAEMGRPFFAPEDPFCERRAPNDKAYALDHFFGKLLRVEDGLHTQTARALAAPRTAFLRAFLAALADEMA